MGAAEVLVTRLCRPNAAGEYGMLIGLEAFLELSESTHEAAV